MGNMFEKLALAVDLPGEGAPGQPLVEIIGQHRALIENHRGVTQYGDNAICIRVSYGHIRISGTQLKLLKMTKQQIIIAGNIEGAALCAGGKRK